jgi:molybdopterin converting factor small subunit
MSLVTLRLNGLLSRGKDNSCTVSFEEPAIELEKLLAIIKAEVPAKAIAFIAVNGNKVTRDILINDGDCIDIFPVVTGG